MEIATVEEIGMMIIDNESMIRSLQEENGSLRTKYYFLKYGLKIGSIVKSGWNNKLHRVVSISNNYPISQRPHVYGTLITKKGEDGCTHNLYDGYTILTGVNQ